jgi:diacylglycerol kinase family enzyme
VINLASGSVSPEAPQMAEKIFSDLGIDAHVCAPESGELDACLRRAIDAAPDFVAVIAGDGTARAAAELAGPQGPLLAPLPGGTMNILPHAIYGQRSWEDALTIALAQGEERMIGGGEVEGRRFLVSAIMGSPALWAPAREALRYGRRRQAMARARNAFRRAFTGRLRYMLDDGPREKAEALLFMCPTASRVLTEEEQALEAAAIDVRGLPDVVRLGWHALVRDWRDDPAVESQRCRLARVWSSQGVPAILDGESVRLSPLSEVRYEPQVARILALPKETP